MDRFSSSIASLSKLWLAILLGFALTGCGGRGGDIAYDPPGFGAPDPLENKIPQLPPVLAPGDVLSIKVYRVDDLSGDQAIDAAGRIKLPLIGTVQAAGKTTDQLGAEIAQGLGARYLQSPDVQVLLKTPMLRTVTVDGSVAQPGLYPLATQTTLIQTIAMARGTSEGANPRRIVVFRTIQGQRMAASFDLETIREGKMADPVIYPDDIVVVDGSSLTATWKLILQSLPIVALFRPFG